jgi:hypothetical protein
MSKSSTLHLIFVVEGITGIGSASIIEIIDFKAIDD